MLGTVSTQFFKIAARLVEDADISNIIQPEASEKSKGIEIWQSRNSHAGTGILNEPLSFQVRYDSNKIH